MESFGDKPSAPRAWVSGVFLEGDIAIDSPAPAIAALRVAQRLADAVEASELSKSEIIEQSGVSRSAFYAILRGEVYPDFVTLVRLSELLGVSLWPEPPDPPLMA